MASRIFIHRDLWEKSWFFALPTEIKLFWIFISTHCDHAGIWSVNRELAETFTKCELDWEKIAELLSDRIIAISDEYWWLKNHVSDQYGEIDRKTKPHTPVFKSLEKHNLFEYFTEGSTESKLKPIDTLSKPIDRLSMAFAELPWTKNKNKNKNKEKKKEKKKECEPPEWTIEIRDSWNDWRQGAGLNADPTASPNGQGLKNLLALAKAEKIEPTRLAICAERYLSTVTNPEFVCHFANFWGRQRRFETFLADDWKPAVQSPTRYQSLSAEEIVYD